MEKGTKAALWGLAAVAAGITLAIIIKKNSKEEDKKENFGGPHGGGAGPHGGGGYRPRIGVRDIYGGSYAFPYTPIYGYDQCAYTDKNGLVIMAPCNSSNGWNRSW